MYEGPVLPRDLDLPLPLMIEFLLAASAGMPRRVNGSPPWTDADIGATLGGANATRGFVKFLSEHTSGEKILVELIPILTAGEHPDWVARIQKAASEWKIYSKNDRSAVFNHALNKYNLPKARVERKKIFLKWAQDLSLMEGRESFNPKKNELIEVLDESKRAAGRPVIGVSRRDILIAAGMSAITMSASRIITEWDNSSGVPGDDEISEEHLRQQLEGLLGLSAGKFSTSFGPMMVDYNVEVGGRKFHPDNRAAGRSLVRVIKDPEEVRLPIILEERSRGIELLSEGDMLIAGGPVGNIYARIAFEFHGDGNTGLERARTPIIPLRWYGLANANDPRVKALGKVCYFMEGSGQVFPNNWPMIDTVAEKLIEVSVGQKVSHTDPDQTAYMLQDNYFTITRLPNFLSASADILLNNHAPVGAWPQMVVLDGRNGLGTRGVELLTQPEGRDALIAALAAIRTMSSSYQVLFRVSGIRGNDDRRDFSYFSRIDFVAAHSVDLAVTTLRKARQYARKRLGSAS